MITKPIFPTNLHLKTAELVNNYFKEINSVDTVLVVNSCARGQATPQSDLDFAILVKPEISQVEINKMESNWSDFIQNNIHFLEYTKTSEFAHIHLDIIDGKYLSTAIEKAEPIDYFELEIGNHLKYSSPFDKEGNYYKKLKEIWLPYYNNDLREERLMASINKCRYDLNHIPLFIERNLFFQAFDILYKAFQEYLQALFIYNKTYPIAYNKWIKHQLIDILNKPDIYKELLTILSIHSIESNEINIKAKSLNNLLKKLEL